MIFIRVDGANIEGTGMGHLYRMIFLAEHLYKKTGVFSTFVISGYQETKDMLICRNLKYIEINGKDEANEILKLNSSYQKDILIIDMMEKDDEFIKRIKEKFIVISFDDTKGGGKYSDLVINSVVGDPLKRGNYFYGPEYFMMRPEIAQYNLREKSIANFANKILICLGGSDPCSINLRMIDWLNGLEFLGKIEWVLGPSVNDKDVIIKHFNDLNLDITPIIDYKDMGELYSNADLCISAAGFSLYEIACVGLPAITICLYPHQIPTARKFEEKGAICNLGFHKKLEKNTLKTTLYKLLKDRPLRSSMSRKGKLFVDGLGIQRVMNKLINFINL